LEKINWLINLKIKNQFRHQLLKNIWQIRLLIVL
jgi:hypothetical protein